MLRKEQNELLTRTGPSTAAGLLFRSYWIPALLADELPEDGSPPVRVKLLSERLLAFRPSGGRGGTGSKRWRAASIQVTSRGCTAGRLIPIPSSKEPGATGTISMTSGRCSR